jgi:hypothetical protein
MMIPSVDNVLSVYRSASFWSFSEGMTWYEDARNAAIALDPKRFHRSAGVIAALSPMNEWTNNKRQAEKIYALEGNVTFNADGSNGIGIGNNVRKAIRIYNGEDALDVLGGPKVRSFYLSIVDPLMDVDPVIDRHAFDIAVGERTNDKARGILGRKAIYRSFVDVYREAASMAGIVPKQMQAVTWVSWKERHGIAV